MASKRSREALAGWLSWLGIVLQSKKSPVQFLVRALAWVAGSVPGQGMYERQQMLLSHIAVSLPLPPFPSPLKNNLSYIFKIVKPRWKNKEMHNT